MELIIVFLGILLDRITKNWAATSLKNIGDIVIIKNIFSFSYLENRGAAFGILQNKTGLLVFTTIIIITGSIFYIIKNKIQNKLLKISVAFIISGAIGNLIDRVKLKYVIDFILIHYKDVYYYPTFNVADMLVVIGTILLVIYIIKEE